MPKKDRNLKKHSVEFWAIYNRGTVLIVAIYTL